MQDKTHIIVPKSISPDNRYPSLYSSPHPEISSCWTYQTPLSTPRSSMIGRDRLPAHTYHKSVFHTQVLGHRRESIHRALDKVVYQHHFQNKSDLCDSRCTVWERAKFNISVIYTKIFAPSSRCYIFDLGNTLIFYLHSRSKHLRSALYVK